MRISIVQCYIWFVCVSCATFLERKRYFVSQDFLTKGNLDKAFRKYPIPNAQRPVKIKALPYSFIIRT